MGTTATRIAGLKAFSRIAAISVALLGAAVLVGWVFDVALLKRALPGLAEMKANTALCFLAGGLAVLFLHRRRAAARFPLARALAAFVFAVGLATLAEHLTGANWGIDALLFRDDSQPVASHHPGRMVPATALGFVFAGLALLTARWHAIPGSVARWLAIPTLFIGTLALIGYAYGVAPLYAPGPDGSMALHTSVGLFLLSLAIIAADPSDGFMAILTSDTIGGVSARRLLPFTTLILFVLGWLALTGLRAGLYDATFRLALMVISSIVVTSAVVAWHALLLHRADLVRRSADAQILALNASLEQRVQQLGALLPICAWCKRIRDEQDQWHSVEEHVSSHSETRFTHAMCPECEARMLAGDLTGS